MNVVANATRVLSAIFIVTIDVGMVRCSAHAVSVILSEIKLRAATGWTRIAIVPNLAREGNVEIVVDTTMGPRQLHVEIHETTCKVERSFRTRTGPAMDGPTTGRPLRASIVCLEI